MLVGAQQVQLRAGVVRQALRPGGAAGRRGRTHWRAHAWRCLTGWVCLPLPGRLASLGKCGKAWAYGTACFGNGKQNCVCVFLGRLIKNLKNPKKTEKNSFR